MSQEVKRWFKIRDKLYGYMVALWIIIWLLFVVRGIQGPVPDRELIAGVGLAALAGAFSAFIIGVDTAFCKVRKEENLLVQSK